MQIYKNLFLRLASAGYFLCIFIDFHLGGPAPLRSAVGLCAGSVYVGSPQYSLRVVTMWRPYIYRLRRRSNPCRGVTHDRLDGGDEVGN